MTALPHARWRSPALGTPGELDLPHGRLGYFDAGGGPAIVFVHGLLVNANLWRKVVERLALRFRCIALDMPLGSHLVPAGPQADLTPPGVAGLIGEALEALDLSEATLVGNDTGGALCQILVAGRPDRVARLVLTSCDYRDNFPPPAFRPLKGLVRIPGATQAVLSLLRPRAPRRLPLVFGWLTKRPIDREAEDSYLYPSIVDAAVRADLRRFLPAIHPRYTRDAADRLPAFDRPALIAWSAEDRFFPRRHAEALARTLPDARLEWIEDSYTFSPEDQPQRLAELIGDFTRASGGRGRG
jgi:pimeloyl-ACP methyl ester carboxylesterase